MWLFAALATAQCELRPNGTAGIPGANGDVLDLISWDPDGAGPRTPVAVLGGTFTMCGARPCWGIATFDPVTRLVEPVGPASSRGVRALAVAPNGDLLAGSRLGQDELVERWNGVQWTPVAPPVVLPGASIRCVAAAPNGDVYVGGDYQLPNGAGIGGFVQVSSGGAWQSVGGPATAQFLGATVLDVKVLGNGDVVAGGTFANFGGASTNGLARYTQGAWVPFGQLDFGVLDMLVLANGDLVIGGTFRSIAGVPGGGLARYDGTTWTALPMSASVFALAEAANGDLVAAGEFVSPALSVGRFDGANWTSLGTGLGGTPRRVMVGADDSILVAGSLNTANGAPVVRVAHWRQGSWGPIVDGLAGSFYAVAAHPDGGFVVSYLLPQTTPPSGGRLTRFDGSSFRPFGSVDALFVPPLLAFANGDVVGRTYAGPWQRISPTAATTLPTPPVAVLDADIDAQQRLVVCGYEPGFVSSAVHRLDASGWTRVGPPFAGTIATLAAMPNGDLVVGGTFPDVAGAPIARIARWDGSAFVALGSGVDAPVTDLVTAPDGRLLVLGSFATAGGTTANGVAYWDGTQWTREPGLEGTVLTRPKFLPDGSLVHRPFSGSQRWDGAQWRDLGDELAYTDANVGGTAVLTNGDYVVAGQWYATPSTTTYPMLVYGSTCPANSTVVGTGCQGASLRVTNRAWTGGPCRVRGEGLGAAQLALVVTGFQSTSIGLDAVLPQGIAGCTLQVVEAAALTRIAFASGGVAESSLAIPRDAALVGVAFRQQMVPVEFDALGGLVAVTSTNAIDHVVGSY